MLLKRLGLFLVVASLSTPVLAAEAAKGGPPPAETKKSEKAVKAADAKETAKKKDAPKKAETKKRTPIKYEGC